MSLPSVVDVVPLADDFIRINVDRTDAASEKLLIYLIFKCKLEQIASLCVFFMRSNPTQLANQYSRVFIHCVIHESPKKNNLTRVND